MTFNITAYFNFRSYLGLSIGIILFIAMLFMPPPSGLSTQAWYTAAVAALMVIWWVSEAIPHPATALLPLLLLPLLGVNTIQQATAPYAHPIIFLFMGGFMLAIAMQSCNLHRRISLWIISRVGTHPKAIILGFMLACVLLSMWISNTATTVMMLPIARSIIDLDDSLVSDEQQRQYFSVALLLGIAYSASLGGIGTIIGTPPNAFMVGFLQDSYQIKLGFAQWMLFVMPMLIIALPCLYFLLTKFIFPIKASSLSISSDIIANEQAKLGPMSRHEKTVMVVFLLAVFLWVCRPLIQNLIPNLSDAGIAITAALLLFITPINFQEHKFALDWESAKQLPWGILILFGGGLSLASAITLSGLANWIGQLSLLIAHLPLILIIAIPTAIMLLLTEFMGNISATAAILPIVASVAVSLGMSPEILVVPTALAASCAFMLPVATPPNAIVFSSRSINIRQMMRAGFFLNILMIVLIVMTTYWLGPIILFK